MNCLLLFLGQLCYENVYVCVVSIFFLLVQLSFIFPLLKNKLREQTGFSAGRCYINLTAGDLKSDDHVNKLIHQDEGIVLRNLKGSPPYFEKCKKDLFAMIRQWVFNYLQNPLKCNVSTTHSQSPLIQYLDRNKPAELTAYCAQKTDESLLQ